MTSVYDFSALSIDGEHVCLSSFRGQILLIVNVASDCGFTKQYAGLQALYAQYQNQGLSVLGFPCNQFRGQEPGNAEQISQFCTERYSVTFPMFDKISVNGPDAHPLYDWLKAQKSGILGSSRIKWNFTKFLVDRDGQVVQRYGPATKPETLVKPIEVALATTAS